MQRLVTEMSKMLEQFTATVMNLQPKNQPPEATSTPAAAQAEIDQLKKALDAAKEIARNAQDSRCRFHAPTTGRRAPGAPTDAAVGAQ